MPENNQFRHQDYFSAGRLANYALIGPSAPPAVDSQPYAICMRAAGEHLRTAQVAAIFVVHGTLMGADATGLHRALQGLVPGWDERVRALQKQLVDAVAGNLGNYHDSFVQGLRSGLQPAGQQILTRRFVWSSENHHLGRADAAVRLIDEINQLELPDDSRVLLWGHSHAGNVFALLSNLVGGSPATRRRFLDATCEFESHGAVEAWKRVRQLLSSVQTRLLNVPLDIVTFGTPVRYGWETRGYENLLHFINHRVMDPDHPARAPFPPTVEQLIAVAAGDYFQQLFIAGTDFPPSIWSRRLRHVDRALGELLQHDVAGSLLERLRQGRRVPDEGTTLLVDYAAADPQAARVMSGHGIYTRLAWLPYHLKTVVEQFYGTRLPPIG